MVTGTESARRWATIRGQTELTPNPPPNPGASRHIAVPLWLLPCWRWTFGENDGGKFGDRRN